MNKNLFIAGDWGTSNLRLYLCEYRENSRSEILEIMHGPGISQIQGLFEDNFFQLIDNWLIKHGPLPVILSGMVGSTIGWREAPYLECPVNAKQVARGRITFTARNLEISIISGLTANNLIGSPDIMRGEELQLLGWMQTQQQDEEKTQIFALPGTHNKWAFVKNGYIETFMTALTGELFATLREHSILITEPETDYFSEQAFFEGVSAIQKLGDTHLIHALFTTRSKQVLGKLAPKDGASYLSGLVVGSDVIGAISLFNKLLTDVSAVTIIGEPRLSGYYQMVLDHLGIETNITDTSEIAIAGYEAIYEQLYT